MDPYYSQNPTMFRNKPILFTISVVLIPVFGLGLLILVPWYLSIKSTRLRIFEDNIELEEGLLRKDRVDIDLRKVRSVRVEQGLVQRLLRVGKIEFYTAGDEPEITVFGMPAPNSVREYVKDRNRSLIDAK